MLSGKQNRQIKNKAFFPAYVVKSCPSCGSKDLLRMEVDALCPNCDWDSTRAYVDSGGMDNILSAYLDHHGIHLSEDLDLKTGQSDRVLVSSLIEMSDDGHQFDSRESA